MNCLVRNILLNMLLLMASCGGGYSDKNWPTGPTSQAFLPFIEAVQVPISTFAGDVVSIKLTVSCESDPSILSGLPSELPVHVLDVQDGPAFISSVVAPPEKSGIVRIRPWIIKPSKTGSATSELILHITLPEAGSYDLEITSADMQSRGGVNATYLYPGGVPHSPFEKTISIPITVLPAEDAPSGDG
jgi:hypothetical protein